jgi:hypothetical protein
MSMIDLKPGISAPLFAFPVEVSKVREFATATGSSHPDYFATETPVVPPTFLISGLMFWGFTLDYPRDSAFAQLDLDRSMLLHAEEEFEFFGEPPRVGQKLTAQSRISEVSRKQGRRGGDLLFVVTETEFRDLSGRLVARNRNTVVKTERAAEDPR